MIEIKGKKCLNLQEQVGQNKEDIAELKKGMPTTDYVVKASIEDKKLVLNQLVDKQEETIEFKGGDELEAGSNIKIIEDPERDVKIISATGEITGTVNFLDIQGKARDNVNLNAELVIEDNKIEALNKSTKKVAIEIERYDDEYGTHWRVLNNPSKVIKEYYDEFGKLPEIQVFNTSETDRNPDLYALLYEAYISSDAVYVYVIRDESKIYNTRTTLEIKLPLNTAQGTITLYERSYVGTDDLRKTEDTLRSEINTVDKRVDTKQDELTAGENITITKDKETGRTTISAEGGSGGPVEFKDIQGDPADNKALSDVFEQVSSRIGSLNTRIDDLDKTKQRKLIAGTNITITEDKEGDVISATGGSGASSFAELTGSPYENASLKDALDQKVEVKQLSEYRTSVQQDAIDSQIRTDISTLDTNKADKKLLDLYRTSADQDVIDNAIKGDISTLEDTKADKDEIPVTYIQDQTSSGNTLSWHDQSGTLHTYTPSVEGGINGIKVNGNEVSVKEGIAEIDDVGSAQEITNLQARVTQAEGHINDLTDSKQDKATLYTDVDALGFAQRTLIPLKISQLDNDTGYITASYHDASKQDKLTSESSIPAKEIVFDEDHMIDAEALEAIEGAIREVAQIAEGKQDTIDDLADIRSGASKGSTSVQPADLTPINEHLDSHDQSIATAEVNIGNLETSKQDKITTSSILVFTLEDGTEITKEIYTK